MLLFQHLGIAAPPVAEPKAWLYRLDHDYEFHETLRRLTHSVDGARPRIAEAVLLLEQYIAYTASVRAVVGEWGDEWEEAVRRLSNSRSLAQVRHVQNLLKATTTRKASY
jgi:hypothetical protein